MSQTGDIEKRLLELIDAPIDGNLAYIQAADGLMSEAAAEISALRAKLAEVEKELLSVQERESDHKFDLWISQQRVVEAEAARTAAEAEVDRLRAGLQVLASTFYKDDQHQDYAKHVLNGPIAHHQGPST